ncbi:MAG: M23 family metallopeptidase, partial [Chloroflexi bacterium]|nr:M23 family metallopeptidase [Chloroflexota bacterium]
YHRESFGGSTTRGRIVMKRQAVWKGRTARRLKLLGVAGLTILIGFGGYSAFGKKGKEGKIAGATVGTSRVAVNRNLPRYLVTVAGTSLKLVEPVDRADLLGVGFHEAENPAAKRLDPAGAFLSDEGTSTVAKVAKTSKNPVVFVMYSRARGTDARSAMDIAVRPGSTIKSPVNGVVAKIKQYYLYDQYFDNHVEIQPDGAPDLRVAIIHIDKLAVSEGTRVQAGVTPIAVVRHFPGLDNQITEYLPDDVDHTHMQVNPAEENGPIAQ